MNTSITQIVNERKLTFVFGIFRGEKRLSPTSTLSSRSLSESSRARPTSSTSATSAAPHPTLPVARFPPEFAEPGGNLLLDAAAGVVALG